MSTGEDGKWFQTLDERYLLPLFSNATASRTFHARRARRNVSQLGMGSMNAGETPADSDAETDHGQEVELGYAHRSVSAIAAESRTERGLNSPVLRSSSHNGVDGQTAR